MPRIVSVWLEHWPVTRLRRAHAGLAQGGHDGSPHRACSHDDASPLVVAAGEATGLRLTAVDARARALGLRPGEPLARARARLNTPLAVHPADPEADAAALDRLCLWAKRYTPSVAAFGEAEGRDGFFLDVAGASHLYGGEAGLMADLARRLGANGLPARLALAGNPGCAFALARHGAGGFVPTGGEVDALRGLPVLALRIDPEVAAALGRLGLRRIGDLVDAPRAPLVRRFGDTLIRRLDQALGHRPDPLAPLDEPLAFGAARGFLDPIGHQDTIVATATRLMETVAPRLEAAGLGARALRLTLHRVDGVIRTLDLALSEPTRCPVLVGRLLDLRLDRLGAALDAGFGFETVRLDVVGTGPVTARQGDLSGDGRAATGAAGLADALRQRLGRGILRLAHHESHVPERAETAEPWRVTRIALHRPARAGAGLPRPLVLLTRSEAAEDVLAPDGPPQRFRWRRRLHRVAHAEGPERIAGEWWSGATPTRDYYVVEDEAGRRLWVYRQAASPTQTLPPAQTLARAQTVGWFVHGMFA
jgi:protein ImuB